VSEEKKGPDARGKSFIHVATCLTQAKMREDKDGWTTTREKPQKWGLAK